jgi:type IV fimbrial biogenesis protein FimT
MERCRGVTLWELLWVLAVAGILLAAGAPAFRAVVLDSRRAADINAFVSAVQLSRSEAAKRGRPVVLCKTADRATCAGRGLRFDAGWMVFVNEDDLRPPDRGPDEDLLYTHQPVMAGSITANRRLFEFRAFGWRSTNGTITFCDERGPSHARAVIVSYTGRPRVSARGPGNRTLACAHLP